VSLIRGTIGLILAFEWGIKPMDYYIAFQIALLLLALAAIVSILKPWDID
jgi:hypothetical protein